MTVRTPCIWGCGREVLNNTECRKCRRQRVHKGLKQLRKSYRLREKSLLGRLINFFTDRKEQFAHSKTIHWARPKQVVRGLHINDRTPHFFTSHPKVAK